ncbi:MAG: molybdopterin oxidoreductase, partial [Bdellovibrionales bacterium]|nr:molybdopterin oxidoreductase [Bdellovibrionales bacterium]
MEHLVPGKLEVSKRLNTVIVTSVFIGVVTFLLGVFNPSGESRVWPAFLTSLFYFSSLALGGLFFTAIQHVVNAGWSASVRRVAEAFTAFLPAAAVLTIVLLAFGSHSLYEWLHADVVSADAILQKKAAYLNMGFFSVRTVVFFLGWILLAKVLVGNSLKQDSSGDEKLTHRNRKISI